MADVKKLIEYFEANKAKLLEEYADKVIVISESMDVQAFSTLEEGYRFGVSKYGYGNFLLKECRIDHNQVQIVSPIITIL